VQERKIEEGRKQQAMDVIELPSNGPLDLATARKLADAQAARMIEVCTCLSWYDRELDIESPAHVSECRGECEEPGWLAYARNRGATLKIVVGGGRFTFCYRSLADFV
jgi:hypothetical protein